MNKDVAREYLQAHEGRMPSEIGEAVDVLLDDYGSYGALAADLDVSPDYLSDRRRIFQLPKGILWKIDREEIGIAQGREITRLEDEDSQWVLALAVVEEKLKGKECTNIVNMVVRQNCSIRDALRISAGVRLNKIDTLMLPLTFDVRLGIYRAAWNQRTEWADFCYQLIRLGTEDDIQHVLQSICDHMESSMETMLAQHRKLRSLLDSISKQGQS